MENLFTGVLGLVIVIFIVVWAILWLFVPFYVYGMWARIKAIQMMVEKQLGMEVRHGNLKVLRREGEGK